MKNNLVVGVDIGGSHITAALVNLEKHTLLEATKVRRHIDAQGSAEAIIGEWCAVIGSLLNRYPEADRKIGIAMPGPFDYKEGIALMQNQNKYDALYGLNVKQLLSEGLDVAPGDIEFMNDAECFLQGEAFAGAARGTRKAIGITLGTGLGSARYSNGKAADADLWCAPFLEGIAEDYLSTRWFIKRYYALSGQEVKEVKDLVHKYPGDPNAVLVFNEFGKTLGLFLQEYMCKEEPDTIVLGGNIARAHQLFLDPLQEQLLGSGIRVRLEITSLGEEAGMMGAASCWYGVESVTV